MQAFVVRRGAFAAAILTICGIAVTSGHAAADDAGIDAGIDGGPLDASPDAVAPDLDATVTPTEAGAALDAETADEFDLFTADAGPIQDDGSLPVYTGPNIFQQLCVQDPTLVDPTTKPFSFDTVAAPYTDAGGVHELQQRGARGRAQLLTATSVSRSSSSATRWRVAKRS